jgi:hypothetical protein
MKKSSKLNKDLLISIFLVFQFMAALKPLIKEGKKLIGQSEVFLKRVLRTNEQLTLLANNLPLEEEAQNRQKNGTDWLAKLLGLCNVQQGLAL